MTNAGMYAEWPFDGGKLIVRERPSPARHEVRYAPGPGAEYLLARFYDEDQAFAYAKGFIAGWGREVLREPVATG